MATDQPTISGTRPGEPDDRRSQHHLPRTRTHSSASMIAHPHDPRSAVSSKPEALAGFDWASTDLGPPSGWSSAWLTAIQLCMDAVDPTSVMLGPELVQLFNDAYAALVAGKGHRFGRPVAENWPEIWDAVGAPVRAVLETGQALSLADQHLCIQRDGVLTEAYFTYNCIPVREPDGTVSAVYNSALETTERAVARRRLGTLRELAEIGRDTRSPKDFCVRACEVLTDFPSDLPFGVIYLFDKAVHGYRLEATFGLPESSDAAAQLIAPNGPGGGWLAGGFPADGGSRVWGAGRAVIVADVAERFAPIIARPWQEPVTRAWVSRLRNAPDPAGDAEPRPGEGLVVLGLGTRLPLDDGYRDFLASVVSEIEVGLNRATAELLERNRALNLQTALATSRTIGAAIGVLMVIHKITEDQAFDLLRRTSQTTHRKLRDVAERVVETGTLADADVARPG